MKNLFFLILTSLSLNAFSQSYIILENGVTLTSDKLGFVYDFGNYAIPQKITLKGGNYFVEEGGILATIDQDGNLYRKYEAIPAQLKGKGMNYFLGANGDLFIIDRTGIVNLKNDPKFTKAVNFGGNYFTVMADEANKILDLYTVTADGNFVKSDLSFKASEIVSFGGNYFMSNRGIIHTVSSDGVITPNPGARVGVLVKKGGNYFVDSAGMIFTVSQNGTLNFPAIPTSLFVNAITKMGTTYFIDRESRLYTVDEAGQILERVQGHDIRTARVISL